MFTSANRVRSAKTIIRQRGMSLPSVIISLVIMSILASAYARFVGARSLQLSGTAIGQQLSAINSAMGNFASLPAVQTALRQTPVGSVVGVANVQAPTVAELKAVAGLDTAISETPWNGGSFVTQVVNLPVGCSGTSCYPATRVWMSNPLTETIGKLDINRLGAIVEKLAGNASYSVPGNTGVIQGVGWSITNPDTASPKRAGIVLAINGWGSTVNPSYVLMNDSRDPGFRGNLSVAGNVGAGSGTGSGTSTSPASCGLTQILASGQILANATNCVARAWINNSGQVGVADSAGTTRLSLDAAAGLTLADAAGAQRARIGFNAAGDSIVIADTISNNAGTATISKTGTLTAAGATLAAATLTATATQNSACVTDGAIAFTGSGTSYQWVRCTAGLWRTAGGLQQSTPGTTCTPNGAMATDASGVAMICSGGQYVSLTDRMGRWVLQASYRVADGGTVTKPSCLSGTLGSSVYLYAGNEQQNVQTLNRYVVDNGSTWRAYMQNSAGQSISGDMIAVTYCLY